MQAPTVQAPASPDERGTGGPGDAMPFEGFDPPESNFWRLPNNWFDLAARFTSWAEHKVVEYILRHTWGYHEYGIAKLITMDEFMHGRKRRDGSRLDAGCGMAENSIKKGIADAVAHGFLIVQTDDSDRGRIKKYYAPRMRRPPTDEGAHAIPLGGQAMMGQGQSLTLKPQALIPAPQSLTLQARDSIPTVQPLIPSHPADDPPTEETLPARHSSQDTWGNNNQAVVVPAQEAARRQGRSARRRHSGQSSSQVHAASSSPHTCRDTTPPAAPRGRMRDRTGLAPAPTPSRATSQRQSAPVPPLRLAASPAPAPGSRPSRKAEPQGGLDLVARLVAEGIGIAKARALVAAVPAERIERQLAWIDGRSYRDRAATLVASIEADFNAPPPRRHGTVEAAGFDRSKYYRGSYALCPRCGGRPCAPGCDASLLPAARRG